MSKSLWSKRVQAGVTFGKQEGIIPAPEANHAKRSYGCLLIVKKKVNLKLFYLIFVDMDQLIKIILITNLLIVFEEENVNKAL